MQAVRQICIRHLQIAVNDCMLSSHATTRLNLLPKLQWVALYLHPLHPCLRDVDRGNCMSVTDTTCSSYTKCPRELISASWYACSEQVNSRHKAARCSVEQPDNTRLTRAKSGRTRRNWCQPRLRYLQAKRRFSCIISDNKCNKIAAFTST